MLHKGAKTRFLLRRMTKAIDICFSIRQGDPLAMILYILYAEPLLVYIERRITGLSIENFSQKLEAYCDDMNIITTKMSDLIVVDEAVEMFEEVSGAILSRNLKCKIMGFGSWKNKHQWPLKYLQTVSEIKVFGFYFMNSYRGLLKKNWDYRYQKFEQAILSWSSRRLGYLKQRVEVIKTFAYSRIYYVASVLPMSKALCKKFERTVGKFIWNSSGRVLRIALDDMKLPPRRGGLSLPCIYTMSFSLQLSQVLRLLNSSDDKSLAHLWYWIGECISDFCLHLPVQTHAANVPCYFDSLAQNITNARLTEILSTSNWKRVTNQMIYRANVELFPAPRVEQESQFSFKQTWKNLGLIAHSSSVHEVLLLLIHDKLPTSERLFRIQLQQDPYCSFCLEHCGLAVIADREHYFCSCHRVSAMWEDLKKRLRIMLKNVDVNQHIRILTLNLPSVKEAVWLISNFIHEIWVSSSDHSSTEQLFGFLKFKYRNEKDYLQLGEIPGFD